MMMKRHVGAMVAALASCAGPGYAAQSAEDRPEVLQKLFDCRRIAEIGARAACYDAQVDAFSAAERDRRVVVIDQTEVRRTRRRLFGFTLPNIKLFSPAEGEKAEEITRLETTVTSVSRSNGALLLTLQDGARWIQSDSDTLPTDPKPGDPVIIRKAAMGSYFANIGKRPAIRVRRIN
jgi:hypothetical protein